MAETELSGILNSISGSLGNFVFRKTKNGIVLANKPSRAGGVPSAEQEKARGFFAAVSTGWRTLSDTQRESWNTYAGKVFPLDVDGRGSGPSGQAIFNKINWYRLVQGLALLPSAPVLAVPLPVTTITPSDASDETQLVFSLVHRGVAGAGRVMVETTPALLSPAVNPSPGDYRLVRGLDAASFLPVQASGVAKYTVNNVRFPVGGGFRFGLRVTMISNEGVPSDSREGVFEKTEI